MTVSVTIRGNYYSSGSISFGSLRSNFRAQRVNGTFATDNAQIKASELRRVTSISNTNPTVPDAVENSNISTNNNLKLSQFRGSAKYYILNQTGTNNNSGNNSIPGLNLSSLWSTNWSNNLSKNIIKNANIAGTVGSYYPNQPAISAGSSCNLIINVSGLVYGGGGQRTVNSGRGGSAIYVNNGIKSTTRVNITSSNARLFAGGGAGGNGGNGGAGGNGGTGGSYPLSKRNPGAGGSGGSGGSGGNGRGYGQNISAGTAGTAGSSGTSGETLKGSDVRGGSSDNIPFRYPQLGTGNTIRYFSSGNGGAGGKGGSGGSGGDWGQNGGNGSSGISGTKGSSSSQALFLRVSNSVSSIPYSGSTDAGHRNRFYIRSVLNESRQGTGSFSGSTGAVSSGTYGPVESYDQSIGDNPNGIYRTTNANMYADDNGASGDDANDLMIFMGGGSNVQLVYQSFAGAAGGAGGAGTAGGLKGSALSGSNVTLIRNNVNNTTVRGSISSLT